MANRFEQAEAINHLLRDAEASENLAVKRGCLELADRLKHYMTDEERRWYLVLAEETRKQLDEVLTPLRFQSRPPWMDSL